MDKYIYYILFFICGILIYLLSHSINGLSIDEGEDEEEDNITIFNEYVYTFHPDPIVHIEQIANRDWSSGLNLWPNYCNLKENYGDEYLCNEYGSGSGQNSSYIGQQGGYDSCGAMYNLNYIESYIYLTRLKLPDNIIKIKPNNNYIPLYDCGCKEFKDENNSTNIYGTQNDNLSNGNIYNNCMSDVSQNNININGSIIINTGFFCSGKDWALNNINIEDITTIYAPNGQFFTLPLVKEITYNCSCNIQTIDDTDKLLNDTEKSLEKYLFSKEPKNEGVRNINLINKYDLIDLCNSINIKGTKYDVNNKGFITNHDGNYRENPCFGNRTVTSGYCEGYYDTYKKCPNNCEHEFSNNIDCKCSNCLLSASNCSNINNGIECSRSYSSKNNKCFWGNCYDVIDKLIDKNNNRLELLDTFECAEFMGKNQQVLKQYGCDNDTISKYCNDLKNQERLSNFPINNIKFPSRCLENSEKIDGNFNCS